MKVIDAFWDTRSLGVKTVEINVSDEDTITEIDEALGNIDAEYVVIKVPSGLSDITMHVQSKGFAFIEDLISVEHDLHEVSRSRILQRMYDSMTYHVMDEDDIQFLYDEVRKGMFSTDRISLDPKFGPEIAARRYVNWLKDLVENEAVPYSLMYRDDREGFIILRDNKDGTYTSVLGAAYEKYRKSGLGIVQKEQEIVKGLGGKKVLTAVSSNNAAQVRALISNGYITTHIEHVFVKHI